MTHRVSRLLLALVVAAALGLAPAAALAQGGSGGSGGSGGFSGNSGGGWSGGYSGGGFSAGYSGYGTAGTFGGFGQSGNPGQAPDGGEGAATAHRSPLRSLLFPRVLLGAGFRLRGSCFSGVGFTRLSSWPEPSPPQAFCVSGELPATVDRASVLLRAGRLSPAQPPKHRFSSCKGWLGFRQPTRIVYHG